MWLHSNAQLKVDAVSIFKMQLFVDNKNSNFRGMDSMVIKNDSLYKAFSDAVDFKLDTLKITGNWELTKSVFATHYQFYQLLAYDNQKKSHTQNIIYKRKLNSNEEQFFMIGGSCVLAINQKTGLSYRLKGFNSNDFLNFLSDFKEAYKESTGDKLSTSEFLKNYKVYGLDFQCLYQGLKQDNIDRDKYPCLKRISDPVWIR
jgi:hypothetical protein